MTQPASELDLENARNVGDHKEDTETWRVLTAEGRTADTNKHGYSIQLCFINGMID